MLWVLFHSPTNLMQGHFSLSQMIQYGTTDSMERPSRRPVTWAWYNFFRGPRDIWTASFFLKSREAR